MLLKKGMGLVFGVLCLAAPFFVSANESSPSMWLEAGWQQINANQHEAAIAIWQEGLNQLPDKQLLGSLGFFSEYANALERLKLAGKQEKVFIIHDPQESRGFHVLTAQEVLKDIDLRQIQLTALKQKTGMHGKLLANESRKFKSPLSPEELTNIKQQAVARASQKRAATELLARQKQEEAEAAALKKQSDAAEKAQRLAMQKRVQVEALKRKAEAEAKAIAIRQKAEAEAAALKRKAEAEAKATAARQKAEAEAKIAAMQQQAEAEALALKRKAEAEAKIAAMQQKAEAEAKIAAMQQQAEAEAAALKRKAEAEAKVIAQRQKEETAAKIAAMQRQAEAEAAALKHKAEAEAKATAQRQKAETEARITAMKRHAEAVAASLKKRAEEKAKAIAKRQKAQAEAKSAAMQRLAEAEAKIAAMMRAAEAEATAIKQKAASDAEAAAKKKLAEEQAALIAMQEKAERQATNLKLKIESEVKTAAVKKESLTAADSRLQTVTNPDSGTELEQVSIAAGDPEWIEEGWFYFEQMDYATALLKWQRGLNTLNGDRLLATLGAFSQLGNAVNRLHKIGPDHQAMIIRSNMNGRDIYYVLSASYVPADIFERQEELATLKKAAGIPGFLLACESKKFKSGPLSDNHFANLKLYRNIAPLKKTVARDIWTAIESHSFTINRFEVSGNKLLPTDFILISLRDYYGDERSRSDIKQIRNDVISLYQMSGYPKVKVNLPKQVDSDTIEIQIDEKRIRH